jgi:Family of unknown function (DUF6152)
MKKLSRSLGALTVCLTLASAVEAHHSRAPFLLDRTIVLEGRITEVEWRSPHVYFEAAIADSNGQTEAWTFEGHSKRTARRFLEFQ